MMTRSLDEILAQADELADAFEAYEPDVTDEGKASSLVASRLAAFAVLRMIGRSSRGSPTCAGTRVSWAAIGVVLGTSGEAARQP